MNESSEMTKPTAGEIGWNELVTTDPKAASSFYGKLFGWQASAFVPEKPSPEMPPYTLFKIDPNTMGVGGMMQSPDPKMPAQWIPYVVVDNVDAAFAKAIELGAKSCVPVKSIGEIGRIAVIRDPQGATIGLHQCSK